MKKKKRINIKIQQSAIKFFGITVLILVLGAGLVKGITYFFLQSEYFKVKVIVIDRSLQFISRNDLARFKGKNIFTIDLQKIQGVLSYKYPQVSNLRVIRQFPDQLRISAEQREPMAQAKFQDQIVTLDEKAIVLSTASKQSHQLPFIVGLEDHGQKIILGFPIKGNSIRTALQIIKQFQEDKSLSSYNISQIDVNNLSKISFLLANQLQVILDRDKIPERIRALSVILTQSQFDIKDMKYVDLRFKEPIIGRK